MIADRLESECEVTTQEGWSRRGDGGKILGIIVSSFDMNDYPSFRFHLASIRVDSQTLARVHGAAIVPQSIQKYPFDDALHQNRGVVVM